MKMRKRSELICTYILICLVSYIVLYFFIYPRSQKTNDYCAINEAQSKQTYIQCLMSGEHTQLEQDDKRVINYLIETGLVEPPSILPYKLSDKDTADGPGPAIRKLVKELEIDKGFYVECGAYDGEYLSNTLYLEKNGWKGLLVEADPKNYELLKSKNRKAWISETCLSIKLYPHRARFLAKNSLGKVLESNSLKRKGEEEVEAQCVPLFTLLSAINVTTVDLFSLDVEGTELQVLRTIPFDKLLIKILAVEYAHAPDKDELHNFIKSKGYLEVGSEMYGLREDFIFVHEKVIESSSSDKLKTLYYRQFNTVKTSIV